MIISDEKYIDELRRQLENIHASKNKNIVSLCGKISEDLKRGSSEDRQKLLDDIKKNDSDSDLVDGLSGCIAALLDAFLIFEACDCPRNAKNMITIMMLINVFSESVEKYVDVAFRAEKSKAKKGKTNKHYDEALSIAKNTWGKYPNASLAGLSEEIYAHLRSNWNGVPVSDTVKTWLKESGLNPDVKPKNRNFKLVLTGEG
ncbi:hypothetical protein ACDA36_004130 [Klebsiella michiganensis]